MTDRLLVKNMKVGKRNEQGNLTIEFVLMLPLLSLLAVVGVTCYLTVLSSWNNDSACRDACRAAAQQMTAQDAQLAAVAACKRFGSGSIGQPQVSLAGNDFEYQTFPNATGQPTLESGPYVKVTTIVSQMPIASIFGGNSGGSKRSYTYPLVNNSGSPSVAADNAPVTFGSASDADGNEEQ
ncbi:MAG: hypothetical protein K2W82_03715 [Candidatus Obscuribacterales bacterium]|nr:hypothetical protein [Candidatus Obscuribacterales bacterium]